MTAPGQDEPPVEETRAHKMRASLAERRERYERRPLWYKIAWVTVGIAVTAAGLGMLALPGPAFVVIPLGLAMLALQFDWAERALDTALEKAEQAQARASSASRGQKIALVTAAVAGIAALVAAAILWDLPLVPYV